MKPIDISRALTIPGWVSEIELTWLAVQAQQHERILEIGSWKGRSTRALADNTDGTVFAVDTWEGTKEDGHFKELEGKPEGWLFDEFTENLVDCENVEPLVSRSSDALEFFRKTEQKFDMIFIDGDHSYEAVRADIEGALKVLAPGGLLCGHDFDAGRIGVVKAVREFFPNAHLAGAGSIWITE